MVGPPSNIAYYIWVGWAQPIISYIIYGGPTQQYRILYMGYSNAHPGCTMFSHAPPRGAVFSTISMSGPTAGLSSVHRPDQIQHKLNCQVRRACMRGTRVVDRDVVAPHCIYMMIARKNRTYTDQARVSRQETMVSNNRRKN